MATRMVPRQWLLFQGELCKDQRSSGNQANIRTRVSPFLSGTGRAVCTTSAEGLPMRALTPPVNDLQVGYLTPGNH